MCLASKIHRVAAILIVVFSFRKYPCKRRHMHPHPTVQHVYFKIRVTRKAYRQCFCISCNAK
jgi:hypothetical protein